MTHVYPATVWLNPVPEQHWGYTQSIKVIREFTGKRPVGYRALESLRLEMGYPDFESQVNILRDRQQDDPLTQVREVSSAEALLEMQRQAQSVHMADPLLEYVTRLTEATRAHPLVLLGVSPRGALAVCRMAKSRAFMHGRDYVLPEDVQSVFIDVCAHRLFLAPKAKISDTTAADVLTGLLEQVRRPDHI